MVSERHHETLKFPFLKFGRTKNSSRSLLLCRLVMFTKLKLSFNFVLALSLSY